VHFEFLLVNRHGNIFFAYSFLYSIKNAKSSHYKISLPENPKQSRRQFTVVTMDGDALPPCAYYTILWRHKAFITKCYDEIEKSLNVYQTLLGFQDAFCKNTGHSDLSTVPDLSCVVFRKWHRENRETISIVKPSGKSRIIFLPERSSICQYPPKLSAINVNKQSRAGLLLAHSVSYILKIQKTYGTFWKPPSQNQPKSVRL